MASTFSNYVATKHGVAESTLLKATKVGHHYNLVNESKDIDNGSVAVIGDRKKADVFEAKVPAKGDKIVLILTAPKIYEEYTTKMQEESNFYNGKGEVMRAYEIQDTDRFTLSTEAFASSVFGVSALTAFSSDAVTTDFAGVSLIEAVFTVVLVAAFFVLAMFIASLQGIC